MKTPDRYPTSIEVFYCGLQRANIMNSSYFQRNPPWPNSRKSFDVLSLNFPLLFGEHSRLLNLNRIRLELQLNGAYNVLTNGDW